MSAEAEVATLVTSDAIAEVIGSDDPLDSPDFDPIEYINAQFPSETSLEKLDPFVGRLQAQIASLDDEISEAVQAQSEAGEKAERDILEAQTAILELHSKIDGIKSKAEESERMVLEICRDIQSLDHAKRNLQTTITALKRLHMLLTAVEQLSATAGEKQYREAANLLDAVRQLLTHFEPYAEIPKIAELQATVAAVSTTLEREIFDAFVAIGHLADSVADPSIVSDGAGGSLGSLSDACLVVDALGAHARRKQVEAFCAQQLAPYAKLFPRGQDVASLDQVERRFVWFRRLQGTLDDKFGRVFPQHWRVQHRVCLLFLDQTRAMLLEVLGAGGPETEKAEVLLKALTKTRMFETEMKEAYEDDDGAKGDLREEVGFDEDGNVVELSAAEKIRRKYAAQRAAQDKPKDAAPKSRFAGLAAEGSDAQQALEEAAAMEDALQPIAGRLSSVYDPFLGPYITLEKKRMEEMLESAAEEKAINEDDMSLPVFTSSVSLFAYVKTAVKRCTPLTTGQTFFNLHKAFKECLENYAKLLRAKFPPPPPVPNAQGSAGAAGASAAAPAAPGAYRLPEGSEKVVCYVINTAEYCAEITPQLQDIIRNKIDKAYVDSIDLSAAQDNFQDVVATAIRALVLGLQGRLEPALRTLAQTNWGTFEDVGEESEYVRSMNDCVQQYIPAVRELLSPQYFRLFCQKFAGEFLPGFYETVCSAKRINEMGTHQLLLDLHNLKALMLQLPIVGLDASDPEVQKEVPRLYMKFVTKHMARVEMVLKLIGTPIEMLVERFKIMWPDGEGSDLQKIMTLKGMKKADQQFYLEAFGLSDASAAAAPPPPPSAAAAGAVPAPEPPTGAGAVASADTLPASKQAGGKGMGKASMASKMEAGMSALFKMR